ncbi:MAG TPA: hypothetical protein PLI16_02315 [Bacteroidales bacterium]|nr:hypothetical protein [Bacteroidales bacterium]HNZ43021.1 hypothetical protein [Bacteroidales bacterium]HOH83422.1 hypothetical protein [Bacteroidales bacterium]HPB25235.1 hypothetical protein [Bacteroidales bacterium]HPI29959.1 hypothetical protein [Bacteroidales bacterium]
MNSITRLIVFIAAILSTINLPAQEDTYHKNDSIINYQNLDSDEARQAWAAMHETWLTCCFYDCLKQNNIALSCARCEKVMLTVDFKIDSNGRATEYRIIKENRCGKPFSEKLKQCFLEYFLEATFDETLRNIVLEISIGNGLKC